MKNQIKMLCGVVALVMAGQVSAAVDWTWTLNTGTVNGVSGAASTTVTATATAWADTGPGPTINQPNDFSAGKLAQQTSGLALYSGGLGINNFDGCNATGSRYPRSCVGDTGDMFSTAPEHAIDNNERMEMVLLNFGSSLVNLTSARFGWVGTGSTSKVDGVTTNWDSDFSILAYTPTGTSNPGLTGKTWAEIGADGSGWTKIGSYGNATASSTGTGNAFANSVYSSLWLIGPYNPIAGGTFDSGNDALKLASVTGKVCGPDCSTSKVPEPNSLALFGLALLGLFGIRKNKKI